MNHTVSMGVSQRICDLPANHGDFVKETFARCGCGPSSIVHRHRYLARFRLRHGLLDRNRGVGPIKTNLIWLGSFGFDLVNVNRFIEAIVVC